MIPEDIGTAAIIFLPLVVVIVIGCHILDRINHALSARRRKRQHTEPETFGDDGGHPTWDGQCTASFVHDEPDTLGDRGIPIVKGRIIREEWK